MTRTQLQQAVDLYLEGWVDSRNGGLPRREDWPKISRDLRDFLQARGTSSTAIEIDRHFDDWWGRQGTSRRLLNKPIEHAWSPRRGL